MVRSFTFLGNGDYAATAHHQAQNLLNRFLTITELSRELLVGPVQQTTTVLHVAGAGIQWHVAYTITVAVPDVERKDWTVALGALEAASVFVDPSGL